jgi:hypothetical protein
MKAVLFALIFFAVAIASTSPASAQDSVQVGDVKIKGLSVELQQTPEFAPRNVKDKRVPSPRSWLEVEVEFEVGTNPRGGCAPSLMFRYYIAIQGSDGRARTLRGDVQHVNIPGDTSTYSVVYVSPATLANVTGKATFTESSILGVGVAIYYDGIAKAGEAYKLQNGWWTASSVQTEPGVLKKKETPFAYLWLDRYADEKEGGN